MMFYCFVLILFLFIFSFFAFWHLICPKVSPVSATWGRQSCCMMMPASAGYQQGLTLPPLAVCKSITILWPTPSEWWAANCKLISRYKVFTLKQPTSLICLGPSHNSCFLCGWSSHTPKVEVETSKLSTNVSELQCTNVQNLNKC